MQTNKSRDATWLTEAERLVDELVYRAQRDADSAKIVRSLLLAHISGGEASSERRFTGVGELERTGYIPAGSASERAVMAAADKYWEASTAARHRVRAELEAVVKVAVGAKSCRECNQTGLTHCQHPDECGGPWTQPYGAGSCGEPELREAARIWGASVTGVVVVHTDHPLRHYDRTCPACNPGGVLVTPKPEGEHHG